MTTKTFLEELEGKEILDFLLTFEDVKQTLSKKKKEILDEIESLKIQINPALMVIHEHYNRGLEKAKEIIEKHL